MFLKERFPSSLQEMASLADQFKEAKLTSAVSLTYPTGSKSQRSNSKSRPVGGSQYDAGKKQEHNSVFKKSERRCFRCGFSSHIVINCPLKHNKVGNVTSDSYSRRGSSSPVRCRSRRLSPYPRVRSEDSDHGRSRNRISDESIENCRDDRNKTDMQATCGPCSLYSDSLVDIKIAGNTPVLTTACSTKLTGMPVAEGKIGEVKVTVLRDTGCNGIVVRKDLLNKNQLTGEEQTCMLADGSRVKVPMDAIYVNTPYFVGKAEAWCMENPMYYLIIGNIRGARDPNNPDDKWKVNAVQTRQQVKNKQKPYPALKVPEALKDINPDDIKSEQQRDITLKKKNTHVGPGR